MQWHELALKHIHKETFHEERKKVHCYKINLLAQKIWSDWFSFTFVIMQVLLLNIRVSQR